MQLEVLCLDEDGRSETRNVETSTNIANLRLDCRSIVSVSSECTIAAATVRVSVSFENRQIADTSNTAEAKSASLLRDAVGKAANLPPSVMLRLNTFEIRLLANLLRCSPRGMTAKELAYHCSGVLTTFSRERIESGLAAILEVLNKAGYQNVLMRNEDGQFAIAVPTS